MGPESCGDVKDDEADFFSSSGEPVFLSDHLEGAHKKVAECGRFDITLGVEPAALCRRGT